MPDQPSPQLPQSAPPSGQFKPNIYPIIYWAVAYGVIAGLILFLVYLLSRYLTVLWFPVFLVGVLWGGYRNYQRQKSNWAKSHSVPPVSASPIQELRQAAQDIMTASREMVAEQRAENAAQDAEQTQTEQSDQAVTAERRSSMPPNQQPPSPPPAQPPVP